MEESTYQDNDTCLLYTSDVYKRQTLYLLQDVPVTLRFILTTI